MKSIGLIASVAIAALSCGCAGIPFTSHPDPEVDIARVAQVERSAYGRGASLYWVNMPTRKAPAATAAPAAPAASGS